VALLVTVMAALGITAPCSSLTVPLMEPVGFCAATAAAVSGTSAAVAITSSRCLRLYRITVSPFDLLNPECERKYLPRDAEHLKETNPGRTLSAWFKIGLNQGQLTFVGPFPAST